MTKVEEDPKDTKKNLPLTVKTLFLSLSLFTVLTATLIYKSSTIALAQKENSSYNNLDVLGAKSNSVDKLVWDIKVITIKRQREVRRVLTTKTDIFDIVKESGIYLDSNDTVLLNTNTIINGSIITIVHTETQIVYEHEEIPFKTEYVENKDSLKGVKTVVQEGVLGEKEVMYVYRYEDGKLVKKKKIEERIISEAIKEIVELGTSSYLLVDITKRGYNCPYWYSVVDSSPYTEEEKRWLKFLMHCESGCNAEHDKGKYKGLFQWNPSIWNRSFSENIFDGEAQIRNTVEKYRAGEATRQSQWPGCHSRYRSINPL
ncbi:hypothetical protein GX888_03685 [Candidatus Dojkabacteria bacterium]|uniref:G5 domain-containing protein n=1 Tax=Candidatus Dojkabacteria bacterium TaxID=2099670 RepID=A0A847VEH1_9BACT|nr:hypothetical protein [Candidatus Dojkabacteria bacterium]